MRPLSMQLSTGACCDVCVSQPCSSRLHAMPQQVVNMKHIPPCDFLSVPSSTAWTQRVKKELFEKNEEYLEALAAHHGVLAAAVKTKQVVDAAACDALDHAIADLAPMYIK